MKMRTRTVVLYSTLAVAVVGAGGLAYGAIDSPGSSTAKTATRLVSATLGTVSQTVSATGTVQPATSLDLNFVNGDVLTAVNVKAGDKVKEGQVLATIDPAKAKVALEMAKANLAWSSFCWAAARLAWAVSSATLALAGSMVAST